MHTIGVVAPIRIGCKHWKKSGKNIINGRAMLNQDFKEFIELLNANDARYLVVGGYAVALYGYPRYTKDLDIWVEMTPANAEKLVSALDQFGFGSLGITPGDFLEEDQIIQLGYPPERIDLLTSMPGVAFEICFESRNQVEIGGVTVNFINLQDLIANKRASGRAQDIADVENLMEE